MLAQKRSNFFSSIVLGGKRTFYAVAIQSGCRIGSGHSVCVNHGISSASPHVGNVPTLADLAGCAEYAVEQQSRYDAELDEAGFHVLSACDGSQRRKVVEMKWEHGEV